MIVGMATADTILDVLPVFRLGPVYPMWELESMISKAGTGASPVLPKRTRMQFMQTDPVDSRFLFKSDGIGCGGAMGGSSFVERWFQVLPWLFSPNYLGTHPPCMLFGPLTAFLTWVFHHLDTSTPSDCPNWSTGLKEKWPFDSKRMIDHQPIPYHY